MPDPAARKPIVRMESKEPRSIRFEDSVWERLTTAARDRGVDASALGRDCFVIGLSIVLEPALLEEYVRVTSRLWLTHVGKTA